MRRFFEDTFETEIKSGNSISGIKSGEQWEGYPQINTKGSTPSNIAITSWMNVVSQELIIRPDSAHVYTFIPDTVVTTTTSTTSSSTSTVSTTSSTISSTSTISTSSSSSSTISSTSTISTSSSSSSTISSTSTISTSSSTSSTISSTSTISTSSSTSSSTVSTSSSSTSSTTTTTYWCYYNEIFTDLNAWQQINSGGGTSSIVGGAIRLDIPSVDSYARVIYQYLIASGDFDIRIDLAGYVPDDPNTGATVAFAVLDADATDYTQIIYRTDDADAPEHRIATFYSINGGAPQYPAALRVASMPSKLRIVRNGTNLETYYYISSWVQVNSTDFTGTASDIDRIWLQLYDNSLNGGSADLDNLTFVSGCPTGYPKAWTTTTSTTTTTV